PYHRLPLVYSLSLHDALPISFSIVETDLAEAELPPLLEGVDGVFHLAAQPGVRASWGFGFDVYVHNNIRATQRLFETASAAGTRDRKSTRLNSSHGSISYAVF